MRDLQIRRSADQVVSMVEHLVLERLPQRISLAESAKIVGVQLSELKLAFITARGAPPYSALLRFRLLEADRLIQNDPTLPLEAIALSCGFGHYGVFHREYRNAFGRDPSTPPAKSETTTSGCG